MTMKKYCVRLHLIDGSEMAFVDDHAANDSDSILSRCLMSSPEDAICIEDNHRSWHIPVRNILYMSYDKDTDQELSEETKAKIDSLLSSRASNKPRSYDELNKAISAARDIALKAFSRHQAWYLKASERLCIAADKADDSELHYELCSLLSLLEAEWSDYREASKNLLGNL